MSGGPLSLYAVMTYRGRPLAVVAAYSSEEALAAVPGLPLEQRRRRRTRRIGTAIFGSSPGPVLEIPRTYKARRRPSTALAEEPTVVRVSREMADVIEAVVVAAAAACGLAREHVEGSRLREHHAARAACFLALHRVRFSYTRMAALVGGRDHSTAMYSVGRAEEMEAALGSGVSDAETITFRKAYTAAVGVLVARGFNLRDAMTSDVLA